MSVRVEDAAKLTGYSPQSLRQWMKDGTCPFGTAVKMPHSSSFTYQINEQRLQQWLEGRDIGRKSGDDQTYLLQKVLQQLIKVNDRLNDLGDEMERLHAEERA